MGDDTIDWDEYWNGELTPFDAYWTGELGHEVAAMLQALFGRVDVPSSVASVGCGPATTMLDLAVEYPETSFRGYDVSHVALDIARRKRDERRLANVSFEHGRLPTLDVEPTAELVYCFNTIHYVAEVEAALRTLFEMVGEGGHLVLTHPTPEDESWVKDRLENPQRTFLGDRSVEWFRKRFQLTLSGESALTTETIERLLGRDALDIRSLGIDPPTDVGDDVPYVIVRK